MRLEEAMTDVTNDVRMRDRREHFRFPQEPLAQLRRCTRRDFDGDELAARPIAAAVDDPEPAASGDAFDVETPSDLLRFLSATPHRTDHKRADRKTLYALA